MLGGSISDSAEERESIGLCVALEALNDFVNHAILEVQEMTGNQGEVQVSM